MSSLEDTLIKLEDLIDAINWSGLDNWVDWFEMFKSTGGGYY